MATKNNFSKAVMDLMGLPAGEGAGEIKNQETASEPGLEINKQIEKSIPRETEPETVRETEVELERKKFLYNAKNVTANPTAPIQQEHPATVISRSMVVVGEITSSADIDIYGDVKGSVKTEGDLKVTGKIIGDLAGNNFTLNGCVIQGNITAKGNVSIGVNTVIVGDIAAENMKLNGKVKGNLNINKVSEFLENALLAGDVKSQTISMSQGAKLHGNVSVALDSSQSQKEFDSVLG